MANRWDCYLGGLPSREIKQRWWDRELAAAEKRLKLRAKEEEVMEALRGKRAEREAKKPVDLRASQGCNSACNPKQNEWDPRESPFYIPPEDARRLQLAGTDDDPDNPREPSARWSFRQYTNDRTVIDAVDRMRFHKQGSVQYNRLRSQYIARVKNIEDGILDKEAEAKAAARPRSLSLDSSSGGSTYTLPEERDAQFDDPLATFYNKNGKYPRVDSGFFFPDREPGAQSSAATATATASLIGVVATPSFHNPSATANTARTTYRSHPLASTFDDRLMACSWREAVGGFWPHKDTDDSEDRPAPRVANDGGDVDEVDIMNIRTRRVSLSATPDPDPTAPEDPGLDAHDKRKRAFRRRERQRREGRPADHDSPEEGEGEDRPSNRNPGEGSKDSSTDQDGEDGEDRPAGPDVHEDRRATVESDDEEDDDDWEDAEEEEDSDMSTICPSRPQSVNLGTQPDPAEHIAEYYERRAKWFGLEDDGEGRLASTL